ncbi:MAG: type VII secretion-associated serine protease mycosin [Mycobacterium sp.]|nr:type VII secretion-associated serine protease mycosin [Mycobacterium sp.]
MIDESVRVCVRYGDGAVDLTLPAAMPIATVLPAVHTLAADAAIVGWPSAAPLGCQLLGGPPLDPALTLSGCGVDSGAVLLLTGDRPVPGPDPVSLAHALSTAADAHHREWTAEATGRCGRWLALWSIALGGYLAVPGAAVAPRLLLCGAAVATAAILGARAGGEGAAVATVGMAVAAVGGVGCALGLPPGGAGVLLGVVAAAVLAGAARLTLRVSGLSAALSAELSDSAPLPDAGPDGGQRILTGFTLAAAVLAAGGAASSLPAGTMRAALWSVLLAVLLAARLPAEPHAPRRIALLAGAVAAAGVATVVLGLRWPVAAVAAPVAAAAVVGLCRMRPESGGRSAAARIGTVAMVAVLPVAAWTLGLVRLPAVAAEPPATGPTAVDSAALPEPARPAPVRPTRQRSACTVAGAARDLHPEANPLAPLTRSASGPNRGRGQRIAVIDTGVTRHRRLRDVRAGGDFVATGDGTGDCDGHGTIVAGIIAATPDPEDPSGFSGLAPDATIIAIRQTSMKFGPAGQPGVTGVGDVGTLAAAVRTAADLGATVINISTVACAAGGIEDRALGAALAYAVDVKDAVVVAAAGNTGGPGQCPAQQPTGAQLDWRTATVAVSPAWYDDYVLTVGSLGADGAASAFTLAGPWVDVAAPGENLVSLNPDGRSLLNEVTMFGRPGPLSGTSYAAPVVSGLAALVRSAFPELTARQVMARLEATAVGGSWNPLSGNGMIDVGAALRPESPAPAAGVFAPVTLPAAPAAARADRGRGTAFAGAGVCAALLAVGLSGRRRLRRG